MASGCDSISSCCWLIVVPLASEERTPWILYLNAAEMMIRGRRVRVIVEKDFPVSNKEKCVVKRL